jgi:hypothetical protein
MQSALTFIRDDFHRLGSFAKAGIQVRPELNPACAVTSADGGHVILSVELGAAETAPLS